MIGGVFFLIWGAVVKLTAESAKRVQSTRPAATFLTAVLNAW